MMAIREITLTELATYTRAHAPPRDTTELHWFARGAGDALAVVRRNHLRSAFELEVLEPDDGHYRVVHRSGGISDRHAACAQAVYRIACELNDRG